MATLKQLAIEALESAIDFAEKHLESLKASLEKVKKVTPDTGGGDGDGDADDGGVGQDNPATGDV